MRIGRIVIVAAACLPWLSLAQHKQFIQAELLKTIKAKNAKVGEVVKARAVQSVVLAGGATIPQDAILLGEVRAVGPNSLSISFEQAEIKGKKTPLQLSIRAAMLPGGPQRSSGDSGNAPLESGVPAAHPINGGPVPLADKTQNAEKATTSSGEVIQPGQSVAAQTGSVIGMPGVTLQVDDSQHTSTFASSGKDLQLKQGLQLMLAVPQ